MLEFVALYADWILFACASGLDLSFLPTVLRKANKPDRNTSILFAVILAVMAVVFLSLALWLSTIVQFIGAIMWGITVFQKRGG